MLGLLVLATAAAATGPMKISGNLGPEVQFAQLKAIEDRYRQQCYFTSQGAICPTLSPTTRAMVQKQYPDQITPGPVRSGTEQGTERSTIAVMRSASEVGASNSRLVTSISGRPGEFAAWGSKKRNIESSCYFGETGTGGSGGNLICPWNKNIVTRGAFDSRAQREAHLAKLTASRMTT